MSPSDAPQGLCDCHIHFYGPPERYPEAPSSPGRPPLATVADYCQVMARLGIERCVVVQPMAYGDDNRCTMDAVAELGSVARAVVVVQPEVSDAELQRLTGSGAVAIRFHMLKGGILPWNCLETMAARVHGFGWHIQLQLDGRLLPDHEATLHRLPGRLVIDHTGKFLEPVAPEHPGFRSLLRLVESGRVWVKLSAPYETSKAGPPDYPDVGRLAAILARTAPGRMLWASNWPHPGAQPNPPDDAMLLRTLFTWVGDDAVARRILSTNPAELYGF